MLRNLLLVSFVLIFSTTVLSQKTASPDPALPADAAGWAGEGSDKILGNETIKARLKKLLGADEYETLTEYFETSTPIEKHGDILFTSGCMIHACTHLEAAVAIDLANNKVHAAIFDELEETRYFNEIKSKTPEPILKWAARLKELKKANGKPDTETSKLSPVRCLPFPGSCFLAPTSLSSSSKGSR